jgi:hypothetical protein
MKELVQQISERAKDAGGLFSIDTDGALITDHGVEVPSPLPLLR